MTISLILEEPQTGAWDADMVAALDEIIGVSQDGRNLITLRVTCAWNEEKEAFEPAWEFLDPAGQPRTEKRRATNLTGFFGYLLFFGSAHCATPLTSLHLVRDTGGGC